MARTTKDHRLDTPSLRQSKKPRAGNEPYWRTLETGFALGYRPGKRGGSWIARHYDASTGRRFHKLGAADDVQPANGINVLSWGEAKKKAEEWFANLAQSDSGEVIKGRYTVADAMRDYADSLEAEKRKSQNGTREIVAAHILPKLGHIELDNLKYGKVKKWRDDLPKIQPRVRTGFVKEKVWCVRNVKGKQRGQFRERATEVPLPQQFRSIDENDPDVIRKRQATANRILTVLKAALNHARKERKISNDNAWKEVKSFGRVNLPKIRFLTLEESDALIRVAADDLASLATGALLTGARYGELARLRIEDFNRERNSVYVAESKNGESRYIPLNEQGVEFFKALVKDRSPRAFMFTKANGKPWKRSEQIRPIVAACKDAHIEGASFHILRHTYASHAVMNGMPIEVLAEVLGHKDTRVTMRHYSHLCKTYKQKLVMQFAPSYGFKATPPTHFPTHAVAGRSKGRLLSIEDAAKAS
jgi:integrase